MRYNYIQLLIITIMLILSGCKKDEKPFNENLELKANLQGTWESVSGNPPYLFSKRTFNVHTLIFSDSTIESDLIVTQKGQCPVKFTFNDGIQYYNPLNVIGGLYTFSETKENNLLWFISNEGSNVFIDDYTVKDGIIIYRDSWQINTVQNPNTFSPYYIKFSNDLKTVEFWDPPGQYSHTYTKVI